MAADEFFKKNPELKALDLRHGYYQREYVRPWAKSPNPDGFKHCPTFTEPSAEKHCFWFQFKKGETYKDLDLQTCSLRLQLLASDAAEPGWEWKTFAFRPDPRLRLVRKSQDAGQGDATKFTCVFSDPALGIDRPAEVRGAKLVFRPARPDGHIYLYFTLETPDLPSRLKIKQQSCDKYSPGWLCDKIRKELDGADPVTCAIDLGIRHLAAATVRRNGKIVRARIIREDDQPDGGPRLSSIAAHKRAIAAKRRKRGKPVRGEESCVKLQMHIDDMGEDRVKKARRRIVNFAHQNGCDLIIMEKLAGLIPDAEKERGINRALVSWNRGHLAKWIKQLAGDAGIRVIEVYPHWTSQLCSRCGAFEARFSADHGRPRFDAVGKLFACPECGYTANADHNASVNLHRKFFGELATVKKIGKGVYSVTGPDQSTANVEIERIQDRLAPRTVRICRSDPTPF